MGETVLNYTCDPSGEYLAIHRKSLELPFFNPFVTAQLILFFQKKIAIVFYNEKSNRLFLFLKDDDLAEIKNLIAAQSVK
jgi:hypothetical protein